MRNARATVEFGDFQTPPALAEQVVAFLAASGLTPDVIVEPTCGLGSFVRAAQNAFPACAVLAYDINPQYVEKALQDFAGNCKIHIQKQDFFAADWKSLFGAIEGTVLVLGNPPWVTNSAIGSLGGRNLPRKSNFQSHTGLDAKTGKANFDISEWMLIQIIEALGAKKACVAMLCKTATARKTIRHAWLNRLPVERLSLHLFNAQEHFGVSVDACLMIVHTGISGSPRQATVFRDLSFQSKLSVFGLQGKCLVADIQEYQLLKDLEGIPYYTWRSGVKHDAARVMELRIDGKYYRNGFNEHVEIEDEYVYPLLKSSDVANGVVAPSRCLLLPQRTTADDTSEINDIAPKTWRYLIGHEDLLKARRSIIYKNRPRFCVFGVGDYTFAPWKVAVSGLYKSLRFRAVGPHAGKPVVFDDTCYFAPCQTKDEAELIATLLNSEICQRFLRALVFFDAKRPLTIDVLSRVDLKRVAERLGVETQAAPLLANASRHENNQMLMLYQRQIPYKP